MRTCFLSLWFEFERDRLKNKMLTHKQSNDLGDRIARFLKEIANGDHKMTIRHFMAEGFARKTIADKIAKIERVGHGRVDPKPGRPKSVSTPINVRRVLRQYQQDNTQSVRTISNKLNIRRSTTGLIKKNILKINSYTKKKGQLFIKDQEQRSKEGHRRLAWNLAREYKDNVLIIDDESYVPKNPKLVPGRSFFNVGPGVNPTLKDVVKPQVKFCDKWGVWQAIAEDGSVSDPVVFERNNNQHFHRDTILKKNMVPWIEKTFGIENVLYWPDLAIYHYATSVREYLDSIGLEYVKKEMNPPNSPQTRPIEAYWS